MSPEPPLNFNSRGDNPPEEARDFACSLPREQFRNDAQCVGNQIPPLSEGQTSVENEYQDLEKKDSQELSGCAGPVVGYQREGPIQCRPEPTRLTAVDNAAQLKSVDSFREGFDLVGDCRLRKRETRKSATHLG